jgi:hypothetical protein
VSKWISPSASLSAGSLLAIYAFLSYLIPLPVVFSSKPSLRYPANPVVEAPLGICLLTSTKIIATAVRVLGPLAVRWYTVVFEGVTVASPVSASCPSCKSGSNDGNSAFDVAQDKVIDSPSLIDGSLDLKDSI